METPKDRTHYVTGLEVGSYVDDSAVDESGTPGPTLSQLYGKLNDDLAELVDLATQAGIDRGTIQ